MNNAYYVHDTLVEGYFPFFHHNHQQPGCALLAGSDSYSNLLKHYQNDFEDEDIMSMRNNMMIIKTRLKNFRSSTRALKRREKSTWSLDTEPSTVAESRLSSNDSIDCVGGSSGYIPEPVCVDNYLPIDSSCTEIEWEPIDENANDDKQEEHEDILEGEDDDNDERPDPSLEGERKSPNARMDKVESIIHQLMERQDEICSHMNETLNCASKTADKMHQKPSGLMRSINKAHELIEQQKRISVLFAESVKRFAKQLDKKMNDSKGKSTEIKRLKADLAETKQALRELMAAKPLSLSREESASIQTICRDRRGREKDSPESFSDGDTEQSKREHLKVLVCAAQEKDDELTEAKALIEDLVEQLREAEEEIEYCVQRERESSMAMQAVLNCTIADQRCEIDELTEKLEHKTTALFEAEARCKLLQTRLERKASKRSGLVDNVEDTSSSTAESSQSGSKLNALRAKRIDLEALVAFGRRTNVWARKQDDDMSVSNSVYTAY